MSEDLAYLAGLFDGEGTVNIQKYIEHRAGGNYEKHSLNVYLSSTTRDIIDWLAEYFGGGIYASPPRTEKHKPLFKWHIGASVAADFLSDLLPYLRIKKEHALIGIHWQTTIKHGLPYSREEKELRELLYQRLKELNRRGSE